ncbi:tRNA CCA-pyrophosphorylase [Anoxybacillus flavithermus TNO-09.006]|uniref:CCA tRNA nucleotidyltransferase n=1 Tax=Anoxybacillus TaxID=150247 RepID=UPI0002A7069C|nr:CCA tRNA nucleotidyltransferase [Anoxybacillus flavithermus]ASA95713.1 CCA tRNA nucleotidyltransferase [Anoxybacillus flavithermus]ELK22271.1 tRNA CCA-pyrophosphorylase [Anoxybacillus flavithermus TNO-09.006]MBE2904615.1 CCA tRNA nucleotidyltransferase [Anoxybacillus flavithermus]MBE2931570.1 CCA tRNA nucleotidyltransferase [Anoxybacillus flavithermus]
MNEQFRQALSVIKTLKRHGHEAYFVGGAVRDYLLQRPIGDIDIATSAHPQEVMAIFPRTVPVGIAHGTVMVIERGVSYEVTTFRKEGRYEDYRRPKDVTFVRSLNEDLQRRDFTMNAIAMNEYGEIIDPFGGVEALKQRIIETVGDAAERFNEDALRMMRALRFVSQLGFSLSLKTKQAIIQYGHLLQHIAVERIAVEFEKLLLGPFVSKAIALLVETNLFAYLPELATKKEELIKLSSYSLVPVDRIEAWAQFAFVVHFHREQLKNWKLSNHLIRDILICLKALEHIRSLTDWTIDALYEYGPYIPHIERIRAAVYDDKPSVHSLLKQWEMLPIRNRKELAINGHDLLVLFKKKGGPWLSEMIENIERAVLHRQVENEKEKLKEWAMCNQKRENNC